MVIQKQGLQKHTMASRLQKRSGKLESKKKKFKKKEREKNMKIQTCLRSESK